MKQLRQIYEIFGASTWITNNVKPGGIFVQELKH